MFLQWRYNLLDARSASIYNGDTLKDMGMKLTIQKWGNSAALRLPATLLAQLDVQIGDSFEADIAKGTLTLRPAKPKALQSGDAAIEAMKYALKADEGMEFLRCWMHGDFDAIRKEWPDAPESVFVGADPALDR